MSENTWLASITVVCLLAAASGYRFLLAVAAIYGASVLTWWVVTR